MKKILEDGVDLGRRLPGKEVQDTFLLRALELQHEEAALLLLKHKADPSAANKQNKYPLLLAAQNGHKRVVVELLAAGVDPLPQESESTADFPFVVACRNSHIEICDLLLVGVRPDAALRRGSRKRLTGGVDEKEEEKMATCHICEERFPLATFPQHIYLCLIHHKIMQEYVSCRRLNPTGRRH